LTSYPARSPRVTIGSKNVKNSFESRDVISKTVLIVRLYILY
jgi:hypothetical protein